MLQLLCTQLNGSSDITCDVIKVHLKYAYKISNLYMLPALICLQSFFQHPLSQGPTGSFTCALG